MAARSKARKRALDVLYEAEQRGLPPLELLSQRLASTNPSDPGAPPMPEYAVELVELVVTHLARVDELLATYSQGWTVERMPDVDRAVLRLGAAELLWGDVPGPVAVDEAVELARALSTDDSPGFVNGVLGRLLEMKPALTA
ncbi:transcription antitermination factor NusB [uncultured Pseudokineococcus sp.]|uniref:transcription antitermination factor NusB n=1 Tax=uncultured Pseudokineococcus sp. TaxID=1642928 RepID=UPI0026324641|nr:transcription antitermination factor NusB [uncultured Pseudokineococcus sp.]